MTGIVVAVITAMVILGGIQRIGEVTSILVPFMAIFYLGGGLLILILFAGSCRTLSSWSSRARSPAARPRAGSPARPS